MNSGLSDDTINKLRIVFSAYEEVGEVILYGSRAKGNYSDGSDIDFTFKGGGLTLGILHRIEDDIDELLLPYKVDLSLFDHIDNDNLLEHISRVGLSFYKAEEI